MKPRRLLLSVAPLPTIKETHEDLSQSLEEYMNSIKELAQPACGPLRISRTQRRKPVMLRFNSQVDRGTKDPLDWLFAQTHLQSHGEDLRRTDSAPAISVYFHFHRSGKASHSIIPRAIYANKTKPGAKIQQQFSLWLKPHTLLYQVPKARDDTTVFVRDKLKGSVHQK
uniref:Uncharacterized protein n=1 Tax=Sinocyclocheilus grahami TaxID=75366 RepID=A0A672QUD5_SINGR